MFGIYFGKTLIRVLYGMAAGRESLIPSAWSGVSSTKSTLRA